MKTDAKSTIETGKAILGIEFGSTRIKAVLIDPENHPIAQGSHTWENQLVDGLWTYSIEEIWYGLQDCYADLRANVKKQYDTEIETLAAIGVSAMMHGYMAFDKNEEILVPFRTWRNTNTGQAAAALSELFVYNIPLRWSISHLYQAILNNEKHVNEIDFLKIHVGQKVAVRLDAMHDVVFDGEISYIGKLCHQKWGSDLKQMVFDVEVKLLVSDERLRPGMTVSCEFL